MKTCKLAFDYFFQQLKTRLSIMSESKIVPIIVKSVGSGLLGGLGASLLFGKFPDDVAMPTLLGDFSVPLAVGLTIGASQLVGESIHQFALTNENREKYGEMLYGFLGPTLAAGASVGVSYILLKGGVDGIGTYAKLAGLSGVSVIGVSYAYDHLLKGFVEQTVS